MTGAVRPASVAEVPRMVELSRRKRADYARYQPIFWREAEDAAERQATYFNHLIARDGIIALVYEADGVLYGFIIGALITAPPVYDPGGAACMVDNFVVADPDAWKTVGRALLDAVIHVAKTRGAVQVIVVCGHHDEPLRALLMSCGCTIASEWWVGMVETGA